MLASIIALIKAHPLETVFAIVGIFSFVSAFIIKLVQRGIIKGEAAKKWYQIALVIEQCSGLIKELLPLKDSGSGKAIEILDKIGTEASNHTTATKKEIIEKVITLAKDKEITAKGVTLKLDDAQGNIVVSADRKNVWRKLRKERDEIIGNAAGNLLKKIF